MNKLLYVLSFLLLFSAKAMSQVGFGTNSPNSTLDVRGGMALNFRSFTTSINLDNTDHTIVYTGTDNQVATLPDVTTCTGRAYWIKNGSTTLPTPILTVATSSSQTIGGETSIDLGEPREIIRIVSNGVNWEITAHSVPVNKTTTTAGAWYQGGNSVKTPAKPVGTISNFDFTLITSDVEKMRLSTNGFLGIGTTAPVGRLHLVNDNNEEGNDYIFADYMNGTTFTGGILVRKHRGVFGTGLNLVNGDTIGQLRFAARHGGSLNRSGGSGLDAVYKGSGTNTLTDLRMFTSNNERLRINENGKLTIDTTAPDGLNPEKLLVEAGHTSSFNVISARGLINNYLQINIQNTSSAAMASADIIATADNGTETTNFIDMGINSSGYNNILFPLPILNTSSQGYLYSTGADFVIGNGSTGNDLIFFTAGAAGYVLANERMRITASGNVGIGNIAVPADKLTVAGVMAPSADNLYSLGTSTNRWSEVWSTAGVISTSDARMKTNIEPLEYGLTQLMKINPVGYNWKQSPTTQHKIGLIAQEMQTIIPEVVVGDALVENLGLKYADLVPVLIRSIQQQQTKLEKLKAELAQLSENAD
jgi:hypothetical protein